ncbi:MAG: hypothetical protein AAGA34_09280 [Pseudomonadota bacterium]
MQYSEFTGLVLLFAAGKRPTRAALRDFAFAQHTVSLTHDPSDDTYLHVVEPGSDPVARDPNALVSPELAEKVWVELLREGLTFDLVGLAPGQMYDFPEVEHRFDLSKLPTAFRTEAVQLAPGQHLAGGGRSMPIVKGLVGLARDLAHHFEDLEAVVWPPSQSAIGRRFFESISTAWLEGGAFPALGLTAFKETMDGALQSVGLEFWIGQELRIEPSLSVDKVAATRLGVRLVNQLVLVGGLEESERIISPDGSRLVMRPSRNRKFIRVWRE